jgi:sugar lactone lactonase YvrE
MKTIPKVIYAFFAAVTLLVGAVTANGAVNDLFVSMNGTSFNGAGSIYKYTSTGVQSLFTSGLSEPRGVALDQFANLFVANNTLNTGSQTFQGTIVKITSGGVQSLFATVPGDNVFLEGLAFDSAGNLFVMAIDLNDHPNLASTIYKFTPNGVQSTFGFVPGQGFGLAFDSAGNLFAADVVDITIYKFTPNGTRSVFVGPSAFSPNHGPDGLAFDRFGNLFVSENHDTSVSGGNARILKFTPNGVESEFATGLTEPRGLAFNKGRNLFVADRVFTPPGDILTFTPDGVKTVFASGNNPELLAFQLVPAGK